LTVVCRTGKNHVARKGKTFKAATGKVDVKEKKKTVEGTIKSI
jgi:hypothetical protein